jgi:D-beta-D-heptose 7-phosphate kinase/D-beta-D-heptose 1-phosphate adenosyltransferase
MGENISKIREVITEQIESDEKRAFRKIQITKTGKKLVAVDLYAEDRFRALLSKNFAGKNIHMCGEESLNDSYPATGICFLVDMIDGTDLLERGLSNWCSAVTVFRKEKKHAEILATYVAHSSDWLYYAVSNEKEARRTNISEILKGKEFLYYPLRRDDSSVALKSSTVCAYAQKRVSVRRLLSKLGAENSPFMKWLGNSDTADFRFYNLAGNPMMALLAQGKVHVVFELKGQRPHDVVAGAYIALRAGAYMGTLDGKPITIPDIETALLEPEKRMTYILACNKELYNQALKVLGGSKLDCSSRKIVSLKTLLKWRRDKRRTGEKVAFTNGCFDILHPGHIRMLEAARSTGDCLVVGLNTDASVHKLKGPTRPVNNQKDRARVLAALEAVDRVVLFGEDTPHELLDALRADILVKGADYKLNEIVGRDLVGKVVRVKLVKGKSTTSVIKKLSCGA